jgi:hypothetical protein
MNRSTVIPAVSPGRQMRVRELAHRATGGLEVILFWHEVTNELTVSVSDERTGAYFEFAAAPEEALDAYYHPYAHAASRGVPYETRCLRRGSRLRRAPVGRRRSAGLRAPKASRRL